MKASVCVGKAINGGQRVDRLGKSTAQHTKSLAACRRDSLLRDERSISRSRDDPVICLEAEMLPRQEVSQRSKRLDNRRGDSIQKSPDNQTFVS